MLVNFGTYKSYIVLMRVRNQIATISNKFRAIEQIFALVPRK